MLSLLKGFLKRIFGGTPPLPLPNAEPFSIGHDWPFPSPEPPNPEYLVGELIKGVEVEGEHVFFHWKGQKRRHIRTPRGTETILARNIVWWMQGRKVPAGANGLTTNCGEEKCLKLSHLILRIPQDPYGPKNRTPEKSSTRPGQRKLKKFSAEDRQRCITRKVYFSTEGKAKEYARELNHPDVRGTGRRQYTYPCPMCSGHHLTKQDPKKYKSGRKVGVW